MDLNYTDEQNLLRESLSRFLADNYSFEQRKAFQESAGTHGIWKPMSEMGLNALTLDEDQDGFGGNAVDTAIVMEELGRALVTEPYLASTVIAGSLAKLVGSGDMLNGDQTLAAALHEPGGRYNLAYVGTKAKEIGDGYNLSGQKLVVLNAPSAGVLLVTARLSGDVADKEGLALFAVEQGSAGLSIKPYVTQDGMQAGDVTLKDTPAKLLSGDAWPIIDKTNDLVNAALCAEAVGAMEELTNLTKEYLQTRQQFGRPLATFQALQFRLVDMLVAVNEARAMSLRAAMMADNDDAMVRNKAVSAAKVKICETARHVGQDAIQLHGGIGMTTEYAAGHYFKRLTMITQSFGDRDWHMKRFIG
jgi:alkylation response protein AidB-like acyl-CoA dehydrogenase